MDYTAKPIAITTSLSLLIHAVAIAGLLLVYGQVITPVAGVGNGVEIQLVSSVLVSDQQQATIPRKQQARSHLLSKPRAIAVQKKIAEHTLTVPTSRKIFPVTETADMVEHDDTEQRHDNQQQPPIIFDSEGVADTAQATNSSQQKHAILELLHRRISDNKEYPYLARRQRREGVATVAFVLHPDGKIENTRLVSSSHVAVLDRAALSAVRHIEPFAPAQEYLKQAEEFQVDIEFELL